MPYYWRNFRRRRWRRRPLWTRRTRSFIPRRYRTRRRRRRYRTKYRVRRKRFPFKLKTILLKQFQPETIRRCKIIGTIPLFQGSPERANNNYIQTIYSYVPIDEPGGGGWTIMIETLSSLWDDFLHLKNIWTQSNAALPLVRYGGVTLKFWQSAYTDYCVQVSNCFPMVDTKYTHADSAPSRMLQKKHIIKVPSLETRKRKKPYKKIFVRPPQQMQNKWYFQKDICNIPLLMIIGTAVDFRYPFCPSKSRSNNVTLRCLNTSFFQFHDFDHFPETSGYIPKPETYMYAAKDEHEENPTERSHFIYLGNTKDNTPGKGINTNNPMNKSDWGNPFWHEYITGHKHVYTSSSPPTDTSSWHTPTKLTEPYFKTVRYNPEKDKGEANTIYLVNNFQRQGWDKPISQNLQMSGFPLYLMCWGIIDWWQKLHEANDIGNHYIFAIITDQFDDKFSPYIPIDQFFMQGDGPYLAPITNYDNNHWQPKVRFQTQSINNICLSGPGCSRPPYENYMQAKFTYTFHMKWGGCPKTLEKPYDPCSQPNWVIPSNVTAGLQIENPNTDPKTILQKWDWRRDFITDTALKRIQEYTPTDETLQILTDNPRQPSILRQTQQTSDSEETSEEEKAPIETQLQQLRRTQQQLQRRILQLINKQPLL
nr:MAG: ORF1 [TTV-like mini virus]